MGIYLEIYALDLQRFERLLDHTLADLLWRHHRTARAPAQFGPHSALFWLEPDADNTTYVSIESKGVQVFYTDDAGTRCARELTEADTDQLPFLRQSARRFLDRGATLSLKFLLRGITDCKGNDFVECLTNGHRRWWIGSVLHHAREVLRMDESDYQQLELLFRKILRNYNCGYPIPDEDVGVDLSRFPVKPEPDADESIGFWTRDETRQVIEYVGRLLESDALFCRPPRSPDVYSDDAECDARARTQLRCLARLGELDYEHVNVLTFIG